MNDTAPGEPQQPLPERPEGGGSAFCAAEAHIPQDELQQFITDEMHCNTIEEAFAAITAQLEQVSEFEANLAVTALDSRRNALEQRETRLRQQVADSQEIVKVLKEQLEDIYVRPACDFQTQFNCEMLDASTPACNLRETCIEQGTTMLDIQLENDSQTVISMQFFGQMEQTRMAVLEFCKEKQIQLQQLKRQVTEQQQYYFQQIEQLYYREQAIRGISLREQAAMLKAQKFDSNLLKMVDKRENENVIQQTQELEQKSEQLKAENEELVLLYNDQQKAIMRAIGAGDLVSSPVATRGNYIE